MPTRIGSATPLRFSSYETAVTSSRFRCSWAIPHFRWSGTTPPWLP